MDAKAKYYLNLVEATDESLKEHDEKYHPDGYREGDACKLRDGMEKDDKSDSITDVDADGGKSYVTPEEDAAYLEAVNSGDMDTAFKMIREAAAKAMPNTKVVGEDGLPMVVYHDSGERHNTLSREFARKSMDIEAVYFHLKSDPYHEYGNVEHRVFLNIKNPADFKAAQNGFDYGSSADAGVKQREKLQREGYDGAILSAEEMGGEDLAEAFVFESNQIKSADPVTYDDDGNVIPLSRRFDDGDDIRGKVK